MNQEETMYKGYDNYWIYGNRRHESELDIQKNDNCFSHLANTNRYKQVQGKRSSSNVYNYVPHPNTVTTSHHNVPNDQHRVTSTQSMLPSPACLQPHPSSLTCQYLPKEVCSAQPNSVPDSCVPLQNQVLRNVQNYNPGQTFNYKSSAGPVNNQEGQNHKTHTNSIRVKDFSLLNNNSKNNNCNSLLALLVSDSNQSQQKRPWYYLHDSPESRQQRMSNGQMQRDHNNYDGSAMVEVNYSYQNYESTASHNYHVSNEEQYSQHSAAVHQHNAQYKRQFCYDGLRQGPEKSSQDFSNSDNYPAAQRKNSSRTITREANEKRRLDSERHSDNNASNCNAFIVFELNEVNPTSQAQFVRSEPAQNALQSPSVSTSHTDPTAKSSSHNSHNEVTSFRVTVPGAAQSTPSRDNSTEASRNSDFSSTSSNLANITLRDCVGDKVSSQKEELDANEGSAGSASSGVSKLDQQEPGCEKNEEDQNLRKETVAVCNTQRALDLIVIPKVENLGLEKDSLEDERTDCRKEAKVQTIKSEARSSDVNENADNIEELSNSEETELPETEDPENMNSLLSENPEDKPETVSTALNESQQSDAVILDEMGTCIELTEDGDEIDSLGEEDSCKSKINRDKLDLLIEFLKEDETEPFEILTITEEDPSPSVTSPQEENPPKKNRRKLSKTSIVRNKNTEREMISLVYKNPKFSSAKSSSTEEAKTVSPKSSDCSKDNDFDETVPEDKQPEDDPCDREPQDSVTPEEEQEDRSPTESTCDCSCYGKGITREERTIINIMRAFQNLKSHFCASCAFTSPVESIWINIVSGELCCLNCFKKMILKADKNHGSDSRKCRTDGPNRLKAAVARKDEEGGGKGNEEGKNLEKKSKCESQTPAKEAYRREDLKNRVEDEHGMCFENSGDLKKDGSDTVDRRKRETRSDEVEKPKRTKSTEGRVHEIHQKKGGEEAIDSSAGSRKRSNSAEEFVLRKRPVLEESEGDMRQNKVIWLDRRVSRSRSRDSCSSQKSTTSEEGVEKIKKHESGRSKTSNLKEGCGEQKFHKTKEGKAEHESKRKGHDMLEKPKRKSMTPEEEIDLKKIRNKHSSEKLKVDVENNKMVEKWIDESGGKARKNSELKKQSLSPMNPQEDSNESEKVVSSSGKMKRRRKREKAELRDPPYLPPRKASAEKRKPSKICERSEMESHLTKIHKKKREHSVSKNDEKTKHSCQKTTGTFEKKPPGKNYKSSKQCLISRLFKGKRCLKISPSGKYLNKEVHKKEPQREEERKREKETKENGCHGQPYSMSFHRTVKNSSHKKRHSGEEPTEGKESQHRTWKNGEEARSPPPKSSKEDKRDKAVGDILEGIVNGTEPRSSGSESPLITRLMKTTTKLSLRLLEET